MIHVPKQLPGLRRLTFIWFIYTLIWIPLEGHLLRLILMAFLFCLTAMGYLIQRNLGGQRIPSHWWLLGLSVIGGLLGLMVIAMSIIGMVLKTGLHTHGPEFTLNQVSWLLDQIPLWTMAGIVAGLGTALISWQVWPPPPATTTTSSLPDEAATPSSPTLPEPNTHAADHPAPIPDDKE